MGKKPPRLRGHFIPNSHLDREWGLDYQQTRKLTVDFIDALVRIFDKVPQYKFLLDSQTVPLEDYMEVRPQNRENLQEAADYALQRDVPVEVSTVEGEAHPKIVQFAEENQVDLIVMSTRGQSGLSRWLMGSVAERVVRGATVPVLLVRANAVEVE